MESRAEIELLLKNYQYLIKSQQITESTQKNGRKVLIVKLIFSNESKLDAFESEWNEKHKYQYQWMRQDNSLLISWGNDAHHPEISTHPNHKHVGNRQNVQPSEEMNLGKILSYIAQIIGILLILAWFFW